MYAICLKASHELGMGHLFRGLNLAKKLRKNNIDVCLLINSYPQAIKLIEKSNNRFHIIKELNNGDERYEWESNIIDNLGIKLWVNDRMETSERHAQIIKKNKIPLVTFDDLGEGAKFSDINIAALGKIRGDNLKGELILCGLDYLILNEEIEFYRKHRASKDKLLVSLGGTDTHGVTVKVLSWLDKHNYPATVILGPGFNHESEIKNLNSDKIKIKRKVKSLIAELSMHDYAITGGGLTAFEVAAMGLPGIIIANEPHEVNHAKYLESIGCSTYIGKHDSFKVGDLNKELEVSTMSLAGLNKIPINGCEKVVKNILKLNGN